MDHRTSEPAATSAALAYASPPVQVLEAEGSTAAGLTAAEAGRRLETDGANELVRRARRSRLRIFVDQLTSSLIVTLLVSAGVALALRHVTDGLVVLAVVILNAVIGFLQEDRAASAIEALSELVGEPATVQRDGAWQTLPARELVHGDVVRLEAGAKVAADARLLSAAALSIDESALTGESVPTPKDVDPAPEGADLTDRQSMAFAGTIVSSGRATAVVVATGMGTELGHISTLVEHADALETALTRSLAQVASLITKAVGTVGILLLGIALLRGWAVADATLAAVSLAVAAIPEGLPAVVTISLAIGVRRMVARKAIVRRLPAVETLGSTTVVCTDKTGTLTRNEMTVHAIWTAEGITDADLLEAGVLCSDATADEGDPTESAIVTAAADAGIVAAPTRQANPRLDELPFAAERRSMSTLHARSDGGRIAFVKGAPEVVLARARGNMPQAWAEVDRLTSKGCRVLAIARADVGPDCEKLPTDALDLDLLGLVGMIDPPRDGVSEAIAALRGAGVRIKMITGDHQGTASAIARQVGLRDTRVVTGAQITAADDDELGRLLSEADVFARVAPEHKLRLVRQLQREGEVVAMTGDGVNDAPALEQADIGVAMGRRGTAAAREASDLVLADDQFATIRSAVEEGRRAYDNIVKALTFVLPTNLGEALVVLTAVCVFPTQAGGALMPIEPVQILWINLIATVTLALPLAFEAIDPQAMLRPPRPTRARLVDRRLLTRTAVVAVAMAAGAIILFLTLRSQGASLGRAQTVAVTAIALFQCSYLLVCRSPGSRVRDLGWFSNPWVFVGIAGMLTLQAAFIYAPFMHGLFGTASLSIGDLALAAGFSMVAPLIGLAWRSTRRPSIQEPHAASAAPGKRGRS